MMTTRRSGWSSTSIKAGHHNIFHQWSPMLEASHDPLRVYQEPQPLSPLPLSNVFDFYRAKHGRTIPQYPNPRHVTVELTLTMKVNERRQLETIVFRKPHVFRYHTVSATTGAISAARPYQFPCLFFIRYRCL